MDLLTASNQPNDDAPFWDSLPKLDEVLRFRLPSQGSRVPPCLVYTVICGDTILISVVATLPLPDLGESRSLPANAERETNQVWYLPIPKLVWQEGCVCTRGA